MKIGRHEYEIVKGDKFLDNGRIVKLITQSKEKWEWGHRSHPVLSKRAVKEMLALPRYKKYPYGDAKDCFIYEIM